MTLNKLEKTAQQLWEIERQIKEIEEQTKAQTAPLDEQRAKLRGDLLASLKKSRLKSVKVESGEMFVRTVRAKFEITNEERALEWAQENNCVRIDKTRANSILLRTPEVPDGFEQRDEEHLTIKKNNEPTQ
jgi:DNA repair ATPase RecN